MFIVLILHTSLTQDTHSHYTVGKSSEDIKRPELSGRWADLRMVEVQVETSGSAEHHDRCCGDAAAVFCISSMAGTPTELPQAERWTVNYTHLM